MKLVGNNIYNASIRNGFVSEIKDKHDVKAALKNCNDVYDKSLSAITYELNKFHGHHKNNQYYEILLGPWLMHFVHQMYDKYLSVKGTPVESPEYNTRHLFADQWIIASDFTKYIDLFSMNDLAIEQQYTQIMQFLGVPGRNIKVDTPLIQDTAVSVVKQGRIRRFAQKISVIAQKLLGREPVIISDIHAGLELYISVILGGLKFSINDYKHKDVGIEYTVDWRFRRASGLDIDDTEFGRLIGETVLLNLPAIYLEAFAGFLESFRKELRQMPKAIFTATGLSGYNPVLSILLAESLHRTKSTLVQHGGNYGTDSVHAYEALERRMADRFITWGWGKESSVLPLPSPILEKYRNLSTKKISTQGITLFLTELPRTLYRLHQLILPASMIDSYLRDVFLFIETLLVQKKYLLVRKYPIDYGWSITERLKNRFEWLRFDDPKRKFYKTMMGSRICVFGNLATTYIQSMVANRPTVVFIDRKVYYHRNEARPFFDELESVGILYYSPIDAARHVEAVYNDVEQWWFSADVQKAKNEFLWKYGRTSKTWMREWEIVLGQLELKT